MDHRVRLTEAYQTFERWTQKTVWRKSYEQPYWAHFVLSGVLLADYELEIESSEGKVQPATIKRLRDEIGAWRDKLTEYSNTGKAKRDEWFQAQLTMAGWALDFLELRLERATSIPARTRGRKKADANKPAA